MVDHPLVGKKRLLSEADRDQKMDALINSTFVEKLLIENELLITKHRSRQAEELAKISEEQAREIPILDAAIKKANDELCRALEVFQNKHAKLCEAQSQKDSFLARTDGVKRVFVRELIETAPSIIDETISQLLDLMVPSPPVTSNEQSYYPSISAAIARLRELKLEPDHSRVTSEIDVIICKIKKRPQLVIHNLVPKPTALSEIRADKRQKLAK